MTAELWLAMVDDIQQRTELDEVPFSLIQKLTKTAKGNVGKFLSSY
jgi:DNA polymerase-3 subunit epsilon